jgi:hypothetical protein
MTRWWIAFVAVVVAMALPSPASALEWTVVGPRAAGMGGAGVAVTTDALATYWNPAGLAMSKTVDIRIQGSVQAIDRAEYVTSLKDLNDLDPSNPANLAQAQALATQINQPGASLTMNGAAGLYVKGFLGDHAFGFNLSDVASGGSFVSTPVTATPSGTGFAVNGQLAVRGLEQRQVVFSYAYAFADRTFSIGITGKIIQGAAYNGSATIAGTSSTTDIVKDFGKPSISTSYGIDVGALFRPTPWLRLGIVAKDLNQPTFDAPGGVGLRLTPQVRGGVAINPYSSLTITSDMDITSNQTFVPNQNSQMLSVGAEQTLLSEFLSLRIGVLKDVQDAKSPPTPTAGLGLRIFALRVDVGAGYDFRQGGALASGSLALTF